MCDEKISSSVDITPKAHALSLTRTSNLKRHLGHLHP